MKPIYIYGKKPVEELLLSRPDIVARIYVQGSVKGSEFEEVRSYARENKISINAVPKKKMDELVGDVNDQGIIAEIHEFPYTDFDEWLGEVDLDSNPSVIFLDELQDVHNVGAIVRTAVATGMSAIMLPAHRQAPINNTVFKTSAGTVMHIPIIRVGNANQALKKLQDHKFWVYGLVQDGDMNIFDYVHDSPTVFVVGSEGFGIRAKTQELCDYSVSIPMTEKTESLNASVSAAVCMYEIMRKQ